jgi:GT2 family glycosyltransferase
MRIGIGIATTGRAPVLAEALAELRRQTRAPDRLVVCGAAPDDLAGVEGVECFLAPRGGTRQRNAILDAMDDCDVVVFFDDDFLPAPEWLAAAEAALSTDPGIVALTGTVLADGASGPGLSAAQGRALLAADGRREGADVEVYNVYGCNMALRLDVMRTYRLRFDEDLPLYGWQEDVDMSRALAPHGRIVRIAGARGVHLGTKLGRTSGVRFGYSQVVNPVYLARRGRCSWRRALWTMGRNLAANLLRGVRPEPWVDRRGRLRGNMLGLWELARGRARPERILSL